MLIRIGKKLRTVCGIIGAHEFPLKSRPSCHKASDFQEKFQPRIFGMHNYKQWAKQSEILNGGKAMRYFAALATAFATIVTANPVCAETWPYDGTGSQSYEIMDAKAHKQLAKQQAEKQETLDRLKASADHGKAEAMFDLGTLLHQGDLNGQVDLKAAYDLYERAAEKGEYRAALVLCPAYLLGTNRPVNVVKAMNTYCAKLKVEQPTLLFSTAYDYEHGLSGPKDETEALQLYVSAAKAGNGDAMNWLGLKALNELGKDDAARQWFRRAASEGSADAMFNLAKMTDEGRGGFQDEKEAAWLYVNAARRGHKGASEWLSAQSTPPVPLNRVSLFDSKTALITQTIESDKGIKTIPFDINYLMKHYSGMKAVPNAALGVDGSATIHCYITAEHKIDVCLTQKEFPIGYNYGAVLQGIFGADLTVSASDAKGQPTAHSIMGFTYRWTFN